MSTAISLYLNHPQMSILAKILISDLTDFQSIISNSPPFAGNPVSIAAVNGDDRLMSIQNGRRRVIATAPEDAKPYVHAALNIAPKLLQRQSQLIGGMYELAKDLAIQGEDTLAERVLMMLEHDAASAPNMIAMWQAEAFANEQVVEQGEDYPQVDREWEYWEDLTHYAIYEEDDLPNHFHFKDKFYVLLAADSIEQTAIYAILPEYKQNEYVEFTRDLSEGELTGLAEGDRIIFKKGDKALLRESGDYLNTLVKVHHRGDGLTYVVSMRDIKPL